jgi:hypothetical protein
MICSCEERRVQPGYDHARSGQRYIDEASVGPYLGSNVGAATMLTQAQSSRGPTR